MRHVMLGHPQRPTITHVEICQETAIVNTTNVSHLLKAKQLESSEAVIIFLVSITTTFESYHSIEIGAIYGGPGPNLYRIDARPLCTANTSWDNAIAILATCNKRARCLGRINLYLSEKTSCELR